ncbi:hypothetical protein GQ457_04G033690 [Hibiscus cannabinus]
MDAVDSVFDPLREFAKDSVRLVKKCHKPDRKEFTKVAFRTAIGFVVMGFVGFFVKLIFIPINNIIVGSEPPLQSSLSLSPFPLCRVLRVSLAQLAKLKDLQDGEHE